MPNAPILTPISETDKKKIIDKLNEKGVKAQCPMCSNKNLILIDGYFSQSMQGNPSAGLVIGGPTIPSVALVCNNCGFMSHHALGALGLLNSPEGELK